MLRITITTDQDDLYTQCELRLPLHRHHIGWSVLVDDDGDEETLEEVLRAAVRWHTEIQGR